MWNVVRTVKEIRWVSDKERRSDQAFQRKWPFCWALKGGGEPDKVKVGEEFLWGLERPGIFSAPGAVDAKGWEKELHVFEGQKGVWCDCHERSWGKLGRSWRRGCACRVQNQSPGGIGTSNAVKGLWKASEPPHGVVYLLDILISLCQFFSFSFCWFKLICVDFSYSCS